jgi:hypothetical protein
VLAQRDPDCSNPFTGRPIRKEDSPGNYEIELVQSKPTYFYFDANGQKISLGVIGEKNGARNR